MEDTLNETTSLVLSNNIAYFPEADTTEEAVAAAENVARFLTQKAAETGWNIRFTTGSESHSMFYTMKHDRISVNRYHNSTDVARARALMLIMPKATITEPIRRIKEANKEAAKREREANPKAIQLPM